MNISVILNATKILATRSEKFRSYQLLKYDIYQTATNVPILVQEKGSNKPSK